jgi:hypothetical protein
MMGLLLKDFINLKKSIKLFVICGLLYGVMAYTSGDPTFFSTVIAVIFSILTLSLYSYDEMAKWDGYALTMPISKENMVQGKYLMMLLLTGIGAVAGILFSLVYFLLVGGDTPMKGIISCGVSAAVIILFYSITLPFITKLGVEKARIIFFAVYIIPFLIFFLVNKEIEKGTFTLPANLQNLINFSVKNAYILLPLIAITAIGISYLISIQIYKKKEF